MLFIHKCMSLSFVFADALSKVFEVHVDDMTM